MAKQKPSAKIRVADGEGGLRSVSDHRFDDDTWLVEQDISAHQAAAWMAHLHAEMEMRGWNSSGISQLDADENSGSLSVHAGTHNPTGLSYPTSFMILAASVISRSA